LSRSQHWSCKIFSALVFPLTAFEKLLSLLPVHTFSKKKSNVEKLYKKNLLYAPFSLAKVNMLLRSPFSNLLFILAEVNGKMGEQKFFPS
jgi:hypothetical protein